MPREKIAAETCSTFLCAMKPKQQQQDRTFVKKKEKFATEALHMNWPALIYNSIQPDFKINKKLVA